jgi:hypothetical protein
MNSKMMIGGTLAMLLAVSATASAYHIQDKVGVNGGVSPERWGQQIGVVAPADDPTSAICALLLTLPAPISTTVHDILCGPAHPGSLLGFHAGDVLFGLTTCEKVDASDEAVGGLGLTGVSLPGLGGLCFMSEGSDAGVGTCTTPTAVVGAEGRSTGWAPAYNGGACPNEASLSPDPLPVIGTRSRHWIEINMYDSSKGSPPSTHLGSLVKFAAQIGVNCVSAPASTFVIYDEQFAYETAGGHVAGFPTTAPAPGNFGTYTVTPVAASAGTACNGPAPFYQ